MTRRETHLGRMATGVMLVCVSTLLLTSVLIAAPVVGRRFGWTAALSSYEVGDPIDVPARVYAGASRTVVLFVRSGCGACQRAQPALARLVASASEQPDTRVVVVTGAGHEAEELAFAAALGVPAERVVRTDLTKLRIKHVPSVVVVDAGGQVTASREAAGSPEEWEGILKAR